MTNFDLSLKVFDFLKQAEVKTIVVCAGARNAPLILALEKENFEIVQFFEERSAAFFALGRMKSSGHPVAVMTTSGTAVAELLPAAVEATYQSLPLVLVTADRPKSFRGSGAPQAIEQVRIFSDYVEKTYDLDAQTESFDFEWSFQRPIHLNICFDEPLMDKASLAVQPAVHLQRLTGKQAIESVPVLKNPLVILGELDGISAAQVKKFLLKAKAPVYAETLSQLATDIDLSSWLIQSSDLIVKKGFQQKMFDSVIRIGGVPTLRFWRDLESEFSAVPVYNFSNRPFSGLARKSFLLSVEQLSELKTETQTDSLSAIKKVDAVLEKQKQSLLEKFPMSEPSCVQKFSKIVLSNPIYLGNSLPIRHWDSFSVNSSSVSYGNRGANGIDGQISTYLGWSEAFSQSYCFVGDLTALYDLAALGLTPQLKKNRRDIVVLNNFGGQIFQRVLKNKIFINEHQIQFRNWALMWGWDYLLVQSFSDFNQLSYQLKTNTIVEIQPDPEQTKKFWDEWDLLCQKI